jgi:hypothetical protein
MGDKWLFIIYLQSVRLKNVQDIIFWKNSSNGAKVFKIGNNVITGCRSRDSRWFI